MICRAFDAARGTFVTAYKWDVSNFGPVFIQLAALRHCPTGTVGTPRDTSHTAYNGWIISTI